MFQFRTKVIKMNNKGTKKRNCYKELDYFHN
jgi:hypothetical protein